MAIGRFVSGAQLALVLVLSVARTGHAQSTVESQDPPLCFGFSFGKWSPALNWQLAGHGETMDTTGFVRAPNGRDWAIPGLGTDADSSFVLFPAWWPAGVLVELPRVPTVAADTVVGRAFAMVADTRKIAPKAAIRAWQSVCRTTSSSSGR